MRNYILHRKVGFLGLTILGMVAIQSRAQVIRDTSTATQSTNALLAYPDVLLSINSIGGIATRPEYFGMSPGELDSKVGKFKKTQTLLQTTSLSTDLFEMLVSFFSKGDPALANQLRNSPVFQRAVATLMNPSALPEQVNIALAQLAEVSGMNSQEMLRGLSSMATGGGEKMPASNKSALLGNLASAKIARALNAKGNGLAMGDFNSPEVLAANEGRIYQTSGAQFTDPRLASTGPVAGNYIPEPSDSGSSGRVNVPGLSTNSGSSAPIISAPTTRNSGLAAFGKSVVSHGSGGDDSAPVAAANYVPLSARPTSAPVAEAAKAVVVDADDPMLSILGLDYADPARYRRKGSGSDGASGGVGGKVALNDGKKIKGNGKSLLAQDYENCRGKYAKTIDMLSTEEICELDGCTETQECKCLDDFQKKLEVKSDALESNTAWTNAISKEFMHMPSTCSAKKGSSCQTRIMAMEDGKMRDIIKGMGNYTADATKKAGTLGKVETKGIFASLDQWISEAQIETKSGKKIGPSERLLLMLNVMTGTNRGLCLLANGKDELPFGENKNKKDPFEYYAFADKEIKGTKEAPVCAQLGSSDLSGPWNGRQSDRIQINAFFHVLGEIEKQVSTIQNSGQKKSENSDCGIGLIDQIFNTAQSKQATNCRVPANSTGTKKTTALEEALSSKCGPNGWLGVLQSAEKELRPIALYCGFQKDENIISSLNKGDSLKQSLCASVNTSPGSGAESENTKTTSGFKSKKSSINPQRKIASIYDLQIQSPIQSGSSIKSGFISDYLNLKTYPSRTNENCRQLETKYYNIINILTTVYRNESFSDIKDENFCRNLKKGQEKDHT